MSTYPELTLSMLRKIAGGRGNLSIMNSFLEAWPEVIRIANLNTPLRQCHFLAQVCVESDYFKAVREYASGADYEGRKDLGNIRPGDGKRFPGRGVIQTTGRSNHGLLSRETGIDYLNNPSLLETAPHHTTSAAYFWRRNKLAVLSDSDNIVLVTKRVNGGRNGLSKRIAALAVAKHVYEQAALPELEQTLEQEPEFAPVKKASQSTEIQSATALGFLSSAGATANVVSEVQSLSESSERLYEQIKIGGWVSVILVALALAYYLYRKRSERLFNEGT